MFHFAGSGGAPLGALNSSLQVSCQFVDWAWRAVAARRMRQASSVRLKLEEDGRPSDDAHISESRYGAPELWAGAEVVLGGSVVIIVRSDDKRQQGAGFAPCGELSQILRGSLRLWDGLYWHGKSGVGD